MVEEKSEESKKVKKKQTAIGCGVLLAIAILVLALVLLVGCAQEAELGNRITILETKLTTTESTIEVLQQRIEQLERASLTEADILRTLEGKLLLAKIYGIPHYAPVTTSIRFERWLDD